MQIVTRNPGESIRIADNIELIVVGTDGSRVAFGIRAPKGTQIRCEPAAKEAEPIVTETSG